MALALPACVMSVDEGPPDIGDGAGNGSEGASGESADGDSVPNGGPATSEVTSAITLGGWNAVNQSHMDTWLGAQVASLNGVTYVVSVGGCKGPCDETEIGWWTIVDGVVTWGGIVPGLLATSKVSLAAFNGYLYMASSYGKYPTMTFLSRFDPTNKKWSFRGATGLPSVGGPPAIAAYNNKLYLIGTTTFPHAMWYATMDAHENFTSQQALPGHDSASRPSATVAFNKLWFAHRWGSTGDIVYGTFDGTTWSGANHIYGGINNGPIQGLDPVIAYDGSTLHLVHQRPNDHFLWSQRYDGCRWATLETSLGTQQSWSRPSLAQGGPGLVLLTKQGWWLEWRTYTRNPFTRPPTCGVAGSVGQPTSAAGMIGPSASVSATAN